MCRNSVSFDILDHTFLHIACRNISDLHSLNIRKRFQVVIELLLILIIRSCWQRCMTQLCVLFNSISVISGDFEDDNGEFCTTMRRLCTGLNECRLQRDSTPRLRPRVSALLALTRYTTVKSDFRGWRNPHL